MRLRHFACLLMAKQILRSGEADDRIIAEPSDGAIAGITQQPAHLSCDVAVVNVQSLAARCSGVISAADGAAAVLCGECFQVPLTSHPISSEDFLHVSLSKIRSAFLSLSPEVVPVVVGILVAVTNSHRSVIIAWP